MTIEELKQRYEAQRPNDPHENQRELVLGKMLLAIADGRSVRSFHIL